jgi:hypothetical protein
MSHPSNKITSENSGEVVRYHAPSPGQVARHVVLSRAAEDLIDALLKTAPDCADRSTAIRCVREAKMWGSAAIALEPAAEEQSA